MIAITATLLGLTPGLAAQDRALTPVEQAAAVKVDEALARQDFVLARTLLAAPELAQVGEVHVVLAQLHASGRGGPVDQAAANQEYRRAAELGHMRGAMILAERLEKDPDAASRAEARSWFTVGANAGNAHALAHLGRMAWDSGDKPAAFTSWAKAAPRDGLAASCLGMVYATGQGASADQLLADYQFFRIMGAAPSEGLPCVVTAGASGNIWAQHLLGQWYSDKRSELYNPTKAVEAFAKAAANGHGRAAYALAQMLDKGDGVPRDTAGAYQNYLRAANDGNNDAWRRLAAMALAGDGVPRNVADAIIFCRRTMRMKASINLALFMPGVRGGHPI
ncbi:MAG: sel1 repeat family protein [Sphingomonadales bacterium]|nr:sel1 repeat family protein [Sphingomonadales bacterium]